MFPPHKYNYVENLRNDYLSAFEAGKSRPQSNRELYDTDFSLIPSNIFIPIFPQDNTNASSFITTAKLQGFAHNPGLYNQNIQYHLGRVLWTTNY
jgi:hypothetical protein